MTTPFGIVVGAPNGTWSVRVPPQAASLKPVTWIFATDRGERLVLSDLMFGRVWLCAGQSNMLMTFDQYGGRWPEAAGEAIPEGALRLLPYRCRVRTDPGVWTAAAVEAARRGPLFSGA